MNTGSGAQLIHVLRYTFLLLPSTNGTTWTDAVTWLVPSKYPTGIRYLLNPLTAEWALRALIDFTLSNARRFYSSTGDPLDGKGFRRWSIIETLKVATQGAAGRKMTSGQVMLKICCGDNYWKDTFSSTEKLDKEKRNGGIFLRLVALANEMVLHLGP